MTKEIDIYDVVATITLAAFKKGYDDAKVRGHENE